MYQQCQIILLKKIQFNPHNYTVSEWSHIPSNLWKASCKLRWSFSNAAAFWQETHRNKEYIHSLDKWTKALFVYQELATESGEKWSVLTLYIMLWNCIDTAYSWCLLIDYITLDTVAFIEYPHRFVTWWQLREIRPLVERATGLKHTENKVYTSPAKVFHTYRNSFCWWYFCAIHRQCFIASKSPVAVSPDGQAAILDTQWRAPWQPEEIRQGLTGGDKSTASVSYRRISPAADRSWRPSCRKLWTVGALVQENTASALPELLCTEYTHAQKHQAALTSSQSGKQSWHEWTTTHNYIYHNF